MACRKKVRSNPEILFLPGTPNGHFLFMESSFYFPHDYNARNDAKIKRLIRTQGYVGYGIFWALIEDLYQNSNSIELDYDLLAYDLRVETSLIQSVINDFDLFVVENGFFSSDSIHRRMSVRIDKSLKAKENADRRWNKNATAMQTQCDGNAMAMQTQCDSNAIKERKGKEIKERKESIYSDEYERFWIAYGRKGNKKDGFKHFQALTDVEKQQAVDCIQPYFNLQPDAKFRKDIERYLAKKHWESFLSTSAGGEVKVEVIKVLPNFANGYSFSLWGKIPKGIPTVERWQWYRENRAECSEVYQHCQKLRDRDQEEYLKLGESHPLMKFIKDYIQFVTNENNQ